MLYLILGLLLVPTADQLLKWLIRRRSHTGPTPLGYFGGVRVVESQIWLVRVAPPRPAMLWMIWLPCAAIVTALTIAVPACGVGAGLLLGGSMSHALETTICARVCDYLRLPCWLAFNVADAAITAGAIGIAIPVVQFMVSF